jgi:hypothetical protein
MTTVVQITAALRMAGSAEWRKGGSNENIGQIVSGAGLEFTGQSQALH